MGTAMRRLEERFFIVICGFAALITSILLILIIGKIALEALPALNLHWLLTSEVDTPGLCQGIANAVAGTILLSILSVVIATPFAVGTAIYLKKYAGESKFTQVVRFMLDVLAGTPSIVLGAFGLLMLVIYMRFITGGFSLLSGGIALSILIMPVIERAAEEAIHTVPRDLEEASYALGGTRWDTIKRIVIPYALPGIITGVILGIGRAAEESAIVVLTAGYTQFFPELSIQPNPHLLFGLKIAPLQDLVGTLPIAVYHAFEFSNIVPRANGFAAALVLIVIVMLINLSARVILWKWKIG